MPGAQKWHFSHIHTSTFLLSSKLGTISEVRHGRVRPEADFFFFAEARATRAWKAESWAASSRSKAAETLMTKKKKNNYYLNVKKEAGRRESNGIHLCVVCTVKSERNIMALCDAGLFSFQFNVVTFATVFFVSVNVNIPDITLTPQAPVCLQQPSHRRLSCYLI